MAIEFAPADFTAGRFKLFEIMSTCGSKRSKNNNQDVITNLPECVLTRILSSLPTKDAVRTSVLSKVWEFKWTTMYTIDVVEVKLENLRGSSARECFHNFLERLLAHSQYITSFRINYHDAVDIVSRLEALISSVFIHNVETVAIHCRTSWLRSRIVLPHSLLSCTSLKDLNISTHCIFKVPVRICFPNLTRLHLNGVHFRNADTDTVRFDLPVLQKCVLELCDWPLNVKYVEIYAPALTSFASYCVLADSDAEISDYIIKINPGVRLAHFELQGSFLENFLLTGSQLVNAIITNGNYERFRKSKLRLRRLLNEISSVKELDLSGYVPQVLGQTKRGLPLPMYYKLVRLKVEGLYQNNHHSVYDGLLELLHAAPFLKSLYISVSRILRRSHAGVYDFDEVVSVPSCIVSHLEEVTLVGLKADELHLSLAKFLLKNGSQLKKFLALYAKSGVKDVLQKIPKGSPCVSIVFP